MFTNYETKFYKRLLELRKETKAKIKQIEITVNIEKLKSIKD